MTFLIEHKHKGFLSPSAISFDDPAVQFGAGGLFETIRVERGHPHLFDDHLSRLKRSGAHWELPLPCGRDDLATAIEEEIGSMPPACFHRLRLTLGPSGEGTRIFVHADELPKAYRGPIVERPLYRMMIFEDYRISTTDPWNGHKSTQFYAYWEARRRAKRAGFDEAILLNERDEIAEGAMSNLFWIRADVVRTPRRECGGLPGVFSAYLVNLCRGMQIEVQECIADAKELESADAVFITNSLGEIMVANILGDNKRWEAPLSHPIVMRIIEAVEGGRSDRVGSWTSQPK